MDQATLQTLARIKIRLRHEQGIVLNTQRFFTDQRYAMQVLDAAEESEDLELVTASMDIRAMLGWIDPAQAAAPSSGAPVRGADASPQGSAKASPQTGRYVFGARS